MARKKGHDGKEILILVILAVAFAIAVAYLAVLGIGFLYYFFFAPSKLRARSEAYQAGAVRAREARASLNRARERYSHLRVTKNGLYDERSNAGKNANSEIRSCENDLDEEMRSLQKSISIFLNAKFIFYSIWAYFLTLVLLYAAEVDSFYWPIGAALFSVIVGFGARLLSGIEFKDDEISPSRLPQVNSAGYLVAGAPLIGSFYLLLIAFDGWQSLQGSNTERILQAVIGQSSQVERPWAESRYSTSAMRGFILFDVEAEMSGVPTIRAKLQKGSAIYILDADHKADVSLISLQEGGDAFLVDSSAIGIFQ